MEESKVKNLNENVECTFCSNPATTQEHIIPKWLQRHYELYEQQLRVWTGRSIPYRFAKIPACQHCNGVRLGNLEKRIRTGKASERDYYLWALKIRYSLAILDSRFPIDPRYPEKGYLLPPEMKKYKTDFILPALASLDNPRFKFEPDPFGSVFLFEQEKDNKNYFGFADVPPPYWAFSIILPPNKILAVLFADRGIVKSFCNKYGVYDQLNALTKPLDSKIPRLLLFSLVNIQNLIKIPGRYLKAKNKIISEPIPDVLEFRAPKQEWYTEICQHLMISNEIGNAALINDKKVASLGYINWRI